MQVKKWNKISEIFIIKNHGYSFVSFYSIQSLRSYMTQASLKKNRINAWKSNQQWLQEKKGESNSFERI